MARPASRYPTELELQILKVLWNDAPLLARDVQVALAEEQGLRGQGCGSLDAENTVAKA